MSESDWESGGDSVVGSADVPEGFAVDELAAAGIPPYAVKLPVFEGPLDLLLHLIRQNEVEITAIPIAEIGAQYLEYLELMQSVNLDIAGEYLVMAATLALIKSRMLLPPSDDGDEDEIDPRAELVARLLEYQRFKEAAEGLARRRRLGRDVFEAKGAEPERHDEAERELEVGLFELIAVFKEILNRQSTGPSIHEIEVEAITVYERMQAVMEILEAAETAEFMRLFDADDGRTPSRALLIATFLAILELVKVAACTVYQGTNDDGRPEGPIRIRLRTNGSEGQWRTLVPEDA